MKLTLNRNIFLKSMKVGIYEKRCSILDNNSRDTEENYNEHTENEKQSSMDRKSQAD